MEKREDLKESIKKIAQKFLERTEEKEICLISHFDTDGITSAAILINTLKRLDKKFSIKIVKSLEENFICTLPKEKTILFLDLASGSLNAIKKASLKNVFIIDHHEIIQEIPENVEIINPELNGKEKISSAGLAFLFCREIDSEAKNSSKLAVLGMIGDIMEKSIENLGEDIFKGDIKKKKGLLLYPSTRPINKVLEYASQQYIPGITGNPYGVIELLRDASIEPSNGKYKSLMELNEDEMKKLTTTIMLRNPKIKNKEMVGDIFLLKFFNKLEDARELSAMINACSRLGRSDIALRFCLEIPQIRREAEEIYAKYKRHLISGLEFVTKTEKIEGKGFVIINAKDNIIDTIIGTIASILSNSPSYDEGTIITAMAYYENKIKVSLRNVGKTGRNVREILESVIQKIGGEVGGHEFAAGCIIDRNKEKNFIELLKKSFEIELIKI